MGSVVRAEFGRQQAVPETKGERVSDNKRTGFVLMYRSLLDVPFKKTPDRFSLWVHLVLAASYDCDEVQFNGNRLRRYRGQIVGSVAQLGEACGVSEDSARRSLECFEREGMIERTTRRGARGYTVITITSYDDYQRGITETYSADLGADFKPASEQGLQADRNELATGLGAELHAEAINNKTNKQTIDPDINPVGSEFADAKSTPTSGNDLPADPVPIPDEAAIHAVSGKTLQWGTPEDLLCAEHMAKDRKVAFERRGLQPPKDPSMARWANDVRLMRERDSRGHRDICELFPLMAGLWPASANQLDGNAHGAAMAFGQLLRGFTPAQIREAVMALANDADRQFAPRPVDVRRVCVELAGSDVPAVIPCVSIRALEMQAEALVLRGQLVREELPRYVDGLIARVQGRGHQVTGRVI